MIFYCQTFILTLKRDLFLETPVSSVFFIESEINFQSKMNFIIGVSSRELNFFSKMRLQSIYNCFYGQITENDNEFHH